MIRVLAFLAFSFALCAVQAPATAAAAPAPTASPSANPDAPPDYAKFTKDLTPQKGLFTLYRKGGKVLLDLGKDQLDTDYIETAVPANGLGGFGITPGLPYLEFPSARIIRFSRVDDKVVVTWPNTAFIAPDGTPAARAIAASTAPSVIATAPIVAADSQSGRVVIDASFLLGDLVNITQNLNQAVGADKSPDHAYHLDDTRSYFGDTKAFPENVIVEAAQTYVSQNPPDAMDSVTDARAIGVKIKYNIALAPPIGSYMPRLADDRVGYYPNIQLDYGNDAVRERQYRTIARWNLARHPMTYYLSNTIPDQYRGAIRDALLKWNDAFAKIGYPQAVIVLDQPDDPNWDPDDIRYNTVHWLTQPYGGGYAQAGLVFDPRTGELIHTSIVIDADLASFFYQDYSNSMAPVRALDGDGDGDSHGDGFQAREAAYASMAHASAAFGLAALQAVGDFPLDRVPQQYVHDFIESIVLHESGHNWGLQHNFIASEAYSGAQVRQKAFTERFGLANSVMEYTPTNIWPKGRSTGDYFQTVLGPYDYYAIKWGYAAIAGAKTPRDEVPTLQSWASVWSDPSHRFAMDEDVDWTSGHAIDPRIDQFDLTNDNLAWCGDQFRIADTLTGSIEHRFTLKGQTHDPMRQAFNATLFPLRVCASVGWHYIGGEELSRAHVGDPNAAPPLSPVSRDRSKTAFAMLDAHLFGVHAWNYAPSLLRQLVYSEWVTDLPSPTWAYDPPQRHDIPISELALRYQTNVLNALYSPALLRRLDDLPQKYAPNETMSLTDLFDWTRRSIFGDLRTARTTTQIRRNVQMLYARQLAALLLAPAPGTPYDAQSLARESLTQLRHDIHLAQSPSILAQTPASLDTLTRAHLTALDEIARNALEAKTVLPITQPPPQ